MAKVRAKKVRGGKVRAKVRAKVAHLLKKMLKMKRGGFQPHRAPSWADTLKATKMRGLKAE